MRGALLLALFLAGCGRLSFDEVSDAAPDAPFSTDFQLSVRGAHSCALLTDGRVSCWGRNTVGELGRGNITPSEDQGYAGVQDIAYLATGEGASFAVDRTGVLWSWGNNIYGQLGLGRISTAEPTPQTVDIPERVTRLATGEYQTCALTVSGDVYCWGADNCMANGDGSLTDNPTPAKVAGVANRVGIAMHDSMACAPDVDGGVLCWGAAYSDTGGCFGPRPAPIAPVGLPPIAQLEGGCHMAMCAVDRTGGAWCWGQNLGSNLGDGTAMPRLDPVRVMGLSGAIGIGTGHRFSCAYTATDVYCWGQNIFGQLGMGQPMAFVSPTAMPLPFFASRPVQDLELGCGFACARAGDDVYCWGENVNGSVGDYTRTNQFSPVRIDVQPH